jgi:aromatic ring-cleaving dioxygenase
MISDSKSARIGSTLARVAIKIARSAAARVGASTVARTADRRRSALRSLQHAAIGPHEQNMNT